MKIFVTGATGFLGRHLVPKLIERGHQVTCLVRDSHKADGLAQLGAILAQGNDHGRACAKTLAARWAHQRDSALDELAGTIGGADSAGGRAHVGALHVLRQ